MVKDSREGMKCAGCGKPLRRFEWPANKADQGCCDDCSRAQAPTFTPKAAA